MNTPTSSQDAHQRSSTEKFEEEASLAGLAAADGLRAVEIVLLVLLGLLICPPLAILVVVVVAPLLAIGLVVGLLAAVVSLPYLLVHHFRSHDRSHTVLLRQRLRGAGRALTDLLPHRIVADARKLRSHRSS